MFKYGELIARTACSWEGTVFAHQGRLQKTAENKGGVDCIGLLVGVCKTLRLQDENGIFLHQSDHADYSPHPNGTRLKKTLEQFCTPIEKIALGDILLFRVEKHPQHIGIVTHIDPSLTFIHACEPFGKVIFSRLTGIWKKNLLRVYRFKPTIQREEKWHKSF